MRKLLTDEERKEHAQRWMAAYYQAHKVRLDAYHKKWIKDHPERATEMRKEWKRRRKHDRQIEKRGLSVRTVGADEWDELSRR